MEYNVEDKMFICLKDKKPKESLVWQSYKQTKANEAISRIKRMGEKDG